MKVTIDNIKEIKYFANDKRTIEQCQYLLETLLDDLLELNTSLDDHGENYRHVYIDYYDEHTDGYSPERTDPCPDYYGYFNIRFEKNHYETVGPIVDLDELDTILCALINFEDSRLL